MRSWNNKILVTGATGFIGRALVAELQRRGHDIRCAVRTVPNTIHMPVTLVEVGEVNASTDWTTALFGCRVSERDVQSDGLLHL